jgi:glycine cleavage system H protein
VIDSNGALDASPESINSDPYGAWIFKMKPDNAADVAALLDATAYQAAVDSEAH